VIFNIHDQYFLYPLSENYEFGCIPFIVISDCHSLAIFFGLKFCIMAAKENRMGILCHLLLVFLAKVCHFVKIFFNFQKCYHVGTLFSVLGQCFKVRQLAPFSKILSSVMCYNRKVKKNSNTHTHTHK
jgi:hypothetical protein